jgi:hypothetical protein
MESRVELHEKIEQIKSKEDLADFVSALKLDLEADPVGWENPILGRFLDAMERWIGSMDNYYKNTGQLPAKNPTWRTFADILLASKMYE